MRKISKDLIARMREEMRRAPTSLHRLALRFSLSHVTIMLWYRIGKRFLETGLRPKTDYEKLCKSFAQMYDRGVASFEGRMMQTLSEHAQENYKAAEKLLTMGSKISIPHVKGASYIPEALLALIENESRSFQEICFLVTGGRTISKALMEWDGKPTVEQRDILERCWLCYHDALVAENNIELLERLFPEDYSRRVRVDWDRIAEYLEDEYSKAHGDFIRELGKKLDDQRESMTFYEGEDAASFVGTGERGG